MCAGQEYARLASQVNESHKSRIYSCCWLMVCLYGRTRKANADSEKNPRLAQSREWMGLWGDDHTYKCCLDQRVFSYTHCINTNVCSLKRRNNQRTDEPRRATLKYNHFSRNSQTQIAPPHGSGLFVCVLRDRAAHAHIHSPFCPAKHISSPCARAVGFITLFRMGQRQSHACTHTHALCTWWCEYICVCVPRCTTHIIVGAMRRGGGG